MTTLAVSDAAPHADGAAARQPLSWLDFILPLAIAGAFMALAFIRLAAPPYPIYDEVYFARTAMDLLNGMRPTDMTHPPLPKLLIAWGIHLWGAQIDPTTKTWTTVTDPHAFAASTVQAWRFASVMIGGLTLVVFYTLARALFDKRTIAVCATGLLALDGVFFVQSRMAMGNNFELCFVLTGVLGAWLAIKHGRKRFLLLAGLGLGLALATRLSSLVAWGLIGLFLLWHFGVSQKPRWMFHSGRADLYLPVGLAATLRRFVVWAAWIGLTLVALPLAIYVGVFLIVLCGPAKWQAPLFSLEMIAALIDVHNYMWTIQTSLPDTHAYRSPWWSWPFMARPVWYYIGVEREQGLLGGVWAIGNAFIWWATLPALIGSAIAARRLRDSRFALLALMGLGLWLMWGIQPRALMFMHYMLPTIPFVCLAVAAFCHHSWQPDASVEDGSDRASTAPIFRQGLRRAGVVTYLGLVVGWFVFYYPLLTSSLVPLPFFKLHIWFGDIWL